MQSNRRKKMIIAGASLFLAVAVVAVGVWLVVSGRVVVTFAAGGKTVGLVSRVCDDSVVTTFNEAATYKVRDDGSTRLRTDEATLERVATSIKNSVGYEDDPTCQTILFWNASRTKNVTETERTLGELKRLHGLGKYPDNNLNRIGSLEQYEGIVSQIKASNIRGENDN